jgi:hypothetical protein
MTIVGILKGLGMLLLYAIMATTVVFTSVLSVVLLLSKKRSKRAISDSFCSGSVKVLIFGSAAVFAALVAFGPYHFTK